jgi:hypothetical protein
MLPPLLNTHTHTHTNTHTHTHCKHILSLAHPTAHRVTRVCFVFSGVSCIVHTLHSRDTHDVCVCVCARVCVVCVCRVLCVCVCMDTYSVCVHIAHTVPLRSALICIVRCSFIDCARAYCSEHTTAYCALCSFCVRSCVACVQHSCTLKVCLVHCALLLYPVSCALSVYVLSCGMRTALLYS